MNSRTRKIKREISLVEESLERLKLLKDSYVGETAYLVTCGPSLTNHDRQTLLDKLDGKLVIACKQAYDYVKEVADFHLLSVYNYQPYQYYSQDTIIHWQLTAMNMPNELERIHNWKHQMNLVLPVYSTPWISKRESTAFSRNFDNWKLYEKGKGVWGPGIMYESGFPLGMHLGCKHIVTIGWDIGDLSKYPSEDRMAVDENWIDQHATSLYKVDVGGGPEYEELKNTIDCTKEMYDWFLENEVNVRILSDTNPADVRFERITLNDL